MCNVQIHNTASARYLDEIFAEHRNMKSNDYSGLVLFLSYNFNNIQFCS